jgi:hypothetical protein
MMKKVFLIVILLASTRLLAQIAMVPTTTIPCNAYTSIVNFALLIGVPPFTFTVETPTCNTTYTASSLTANAFFTVGCQGIYTLTVNDALSTYAPSATHTVVYETFVDAGIAPSSLSDTICLGTSVYLFASGIPLNTISPITWNTGETTEFIIVSPTVTTSYSYTGVSSYPMMTRTCTAIGTSTIFVIPCNDGVGIRNLSQLDFKIYPNPIKNILYLDFEQSSTKLEISNSLGQTVYSSNEPQPKQEIDVSFLSSGAYILKLQSEEKQRNIKLIKE